MSDTDPRALVGSLRTRLREVDGISGAAIDGVDIDVLSAEFDQQPHPVESVSKQTGETADHNVLDGAIVIAKMLEELLVFLTFVGVPARSLSVVIDLVEAIVDAVLGDRVDLLRDALALLAEPCVSYRGFTHRFL